MKPSSAKGALMAVASTYAAASFLSDAMGYAFRCHILVLDDFQVVSFKTEDGSRVFTACHRPLEQGRLRASTPLLVSWYTGHTNSTADEDKHQSQQSVSLDH